MLCNCLLPWFILWSFAIAIAKWSAGVSSKGGTLLAHLSLFLLVRELKKQNKKTGADLKWRVQVWVLLVVWGGASLWGWKCWAKPHCHCSENTWLLLASCCVPDPLFWSGKKKVWSLFLKGNVMFAKDSRVLALGLKSSPRTQHRAGLAVLQDSSPAQRGRDPPLPPGEERRGELSPVHSMLAFPLKLPRRMPIFPFSCLLYRP